MSDVIRHPFRPDWDPYFLDIAAAVSARATCPRLAVGALFVSPDHHILATGYNGAPKGMPHCADEGCLIRDNHCVRVLHAERNAIMMAARHGVSLAGATCYVTHSPCAECTLHLIQVGVTVIRYRYPYANALAEQFVRESGITLIQVP